MPLLDNLDQFSNALGQAYGAGGPGDPLIAIGMGLLSRRGLGPAIGQGFQNVAAVGELANVRKRQDMQDQLMAAQVNRANRRQIYTNPNTGVVSTYDPNNPDAGLSAIPGQSASSGAHWATESELPPGYKGPAPFMDAKGMPHFQPAGTTVNTSPGPGPKVFDEVKDRAGEARSVANSLPMFGQAKELLKDPNIITGFGAEDRLALQKFGTLFGMDPTAVQNTEVLRSSVAPIVLSTVKGLGSGSGISNADRDFAEKAAGGDIKLDAGSMLRLMDIGERAARYKVGEYKRMLDQVYPETDPNNAQVRALFGVREPDYAPPKVTPNAEAKPSQPDQPQKNAGKLQPPPQDILSQAKEALAKRPDMRKEILNRLMKNGFDPSGL